MYGSRPGPALNLSAVPGVSRLCVLLRDIREPGRAARTPRPWPMDPRPLLLRLNASWPRLFDTGEGARPPTNPEPYVRRSGQMPEVQDSSPSSPGGRQKGSRRGSTHAPYLRRRHPRPTRRAANQRYPCYVPSPGGYIKTVRSSVRVVIPLPSGSGRRVSPPPQVPKPGDSRPKKEEQWVYASRNPVVPSRNP